VVLAYSWRSVVYSIGKEHGQNRGPTSTSGLVHTQSGNLGISMVDDMRLPTFRGDGSEDLDQHWFLCEVVWSINNFTREVTK
jgi:hypothetical protein